MARTPYNGVKWQQRRKGEVCPCCGQARPKTRSWWRTIQRSIDGMWRVIVRPQSYRIQRLDKVQAIGRMVWIDVQRIGRAKAMYGHTTRPDEIDAAVAAMHRRMKEHNAAKGNTILL